MRHSKQVLSYFFETRHAGVLDKNDAKVRYGEIGGKAQSYLFRLYLRCENDTIKEAKFQAYGSVMATAACEYVCRWGEGKTLKAAKQLNQDKIQKALNLSSLEVHAAALIGHLWKKTIEGR